MRLSFLKYYCGCSCFVFLLAICSSCEKAAEKRRFEEIVISDSQAQMPESPMMGDIPMHDMPMAETAQSPVRWTAPDGWQEKAASGMRLATFVVDGGAAKADCSIVILGGEAGNLKANVDRWAQQINVRLSPEELDKFISRQEKIATKDGLSANLADFTALDSDPSIVAAIIAASGKIVFVKLTGPRGVLKQNLAKFKLLCQSIEIAHD